jgi:hypothetical protein
VDIPWSPAARVAHRRESKAALVIKHILPVAVLLHELLEQAPQSPRAAANMLRAFTMIAVVTPSDCRALAAAGLADRG